VAYKYETAITAGLSGYLRVNEVAIENAVVVCPEGNEYLSVGELSFL